jgi:3-deoxy-D-manno-octulosonic-acid transferase
MSSRALSLQAYLTATRGAGSDTPQPLPPRPQGPLVLAVANGAERCRALSSLCARLRALNPEISVICAGDMPTAAEMAIVALPPDRSAPCDAFVRALKPEVVLWSGLDLHPALLQALHDAGSHLIALDLADEPARVPGAPRWLPDPAPATLALFHSLYAVNAAAARRLRRAGVDVGRVITAAPLLGVTQPLSCPDGLHEEVTGYLRGRPVWLAARLHAHEAGDVLSAHRHAVRLNHRLLLVMVPASEEEHASILAQASHARLRLCQWDMGETPDENTQVILTETPDELGLWYRVAPLAFLGGSLVSGIGGYDPFEAASLGAAILYGPNVGGHLSAYTKLVAAGAARIVRDSDSLASAVLNLVAPDQAATMAHAGWDVITAGAEVVDRILTEITETLDAGAVA